MTRNTHKSKHFKHVDPWPRFDPETITDREQAERDRFARIAAVKLEVRFGPDSDIAQMLGLAVAS